MQEQGGGSTSQPEGEGETPPKQARMPFMRGLIQEMGGNPQDLISPPPHRKMKRRGGVKRAAQRGSRVREGAPTPLGGRGAPYEQA